MNLLLSPTKLMAIALALLLLMGASVVVGWHVRGWHDDSAQLKQTRADISGMHTQMVDVVNASNHLTDTITRQNKVTDDSIAQFTTTLGSQDHALTQIQVDIKSLPVGDCRLTPDADGLYQRAYQAAFGTSIHPAAATGKASGRDAAYPAAPGTRSD
jgi:hypothetical protein